MDKARRIYERRFGRIAGAGVSIGAVTLAGFVAAARHRYAIDLSYSAVTALFGASMAIGPVAGRFARVLARRRLQRQMQAEVALQPSVPAGIMERFVAARNATALEEASVAWPLTNRAVMGVVGWLWALGLFSVSGFDIVGKAFGFAMSSGALSMAAIAGAAYWGAKRMTRRAPRSSLARSVASVFVLGGAFAAGLENLLRADQQALAAVVYFAVGGIAVLLPSVWKSKQRLRVERTSLAAHPLLPPGENIEAENERLAATVEWQEGPPEIRAEALRSLLPRIDAKARAQHLDRALESHLVPLRRTALQLCHKLRHAPPLSQLSALAHDELLPAEDAALLPALLHRHRSPDVEVELTHLLGHPSLEVRERAALSLGLVGSASCVAAIREAGRAGGHLSHLCQEAIERVQIRLSQAPGQLSLADSPEDGALSEAQDTGALSFSR